jgi:hypothetical protein
VLILADGTAASLFATLLVQVFLSLVDEGKSHRKGHLNQPDLSCSCLCLHLHLIRGGEEVDPLDQLNFAVVVVPADQVVFVSVGLLLYAVVHTEHAAWVLHLTDHRLDQLPQVCRGELPLRQEASNLVMTDCLPQQSRQPGGRGSSERTDQVVNVQVQKYFVHV